jgi:hypothetical protein
VSSVTFSFREQAPPRPAAELLAEIRERGGRVYRFRVERVFCLTDDPALVEWLLGLGARGFTAVGDNPLARELPGAYYRSNRERKIEYDLWLDPIPVEDDLWEAAA